jgi:hypothetical protein
VRKPSDHLLPPDSAKSEAPHPPPGDAEPLARSIRSYLRRLVGSLPVPGPLKGAPGRPNPTAAAAAAAAARGGSTAAAAAPAGGGVALLVVLDDVVEGHVERIRHGCSRWADLAGGGLGLAREGGEVDGAGGGEM